MSAKPTEGYGPVGHEAVDEGNLYNQAKRDNVQASAPPVRYCKFTSKNNGYDQKIVAAFILFLRMAVKDEARIRLDEIVI